MLLLKQHSVQPAGSSLHNRSKPKKQTCSSEIELESSYKLRKKDGRDSNLTLWSDSEAEAGERRRKTHATTDNREGTAEKDAISEPGGGSDLRARWWRERERERERDVLPILFSFSLNLIFDSKNWDRQNCVESI